MIPVRRGYSLIELLVAVALSSLLLGLVFAFIVPTMRALARGSSRTDMEQQVAISLSRMTQDLQQTSSQGLSVSWSLGGPTPAPPLALGIDKVLDVTPCGGRVWAIGAFLPPAPDGATDPGLVVYGWDKVGGQLTRGVWMSNSQPPLVGLLNSHANIVGSTQLLDIAASPGLYLKQVLATGVQSFSVSFPAAGACGTPQSPVMLSLQLSRTAATGAAQPQIYQCSRTVSLRISS